MKEADAPPAPSRVRTVLADLKTRVVILLLVLWAVNVLYPSEVPPDGVRHRDEAAADVHAASAADALNDRMRSSHVEPGATSVDYHIRKSTWPLARPLPLRAAAAPPASASAIAASVSSSTAPFGLGPRAHELASALAGRTSPSAAFCASLAACVDGGRPGKSRADGAAAGRPDARTGAMGATRCEKGVGTGAALGAGTVGKAGGATREAEAQGVLPEPALRPPPGVRPGTTRWFAAVPRAG